MDLDHRMGEWQREPQGGFVHWRCSEGRTFYYGAPNVRAAALRENTMGKVLKVLARLGQQKKDAGDERPEGWDR